MSYSNYDRHYRQSGHAAQRYQGYAQQADYDEDVDDQESSDDEEDEEDENTRYQQQAGYHQHAASYQQAAYQNGYATSSLPMRINTSSSGYATNYSGYPGYSTPSSTDSSSTYSTSPTSPSSYYSQKSRYSQQPEFVCLFQGCHHTSARKADLERHVRIVHNREAVQLVDCAYQGCHRHGTYGFTRKDKMIDHMREVHKVDIPKRSIGRRDPRSR